MEEKRLGVIVIGHFGVDSVKGSLCDAILHRIEHSEVSSVILVNLDKNESNSEIAPVAPSFKIEDLIREVKLSPVREFEGPFYKGILPDLLPVYKASNGSVLNKKNLFYTKKHTKV